MYFKPSLYMEFAKSLDLSGIRSNLAFSGITCPYSWEELGINGRIFEKTEFYPYGHNELKAAIAQRYGVRPEQVLIPGGGTSLCNYILGAVLVGPGDRVLLETPTYECLHAAFASTGAEVISFQRSPENGYDINLDEIDHLLRPLVKLAVVTRLHNPSGRNLSPEVLLHLAESAERVGAYVLVDEVYLDFLPPGSFQVAAALHPRLLTTASLTKVYGLGDLRIGWGIGPEELIGQCWRFNNLLGVNPPTPPDQIALELFRNGGLDRLAAWSRQRASENWGILEQFLSNRTDLQWVKPEGGIIAFLRLNGMRQADAFLDRLREEYRTLVMPGRFFGQEDGFRLGFGIPAEKLREGLKRLDRALQELNN